MMTETRHPRLLMGSLLVACAATLGALGCWTDRAANSSGPEPQSSTRTPDDERERPAEVETNRFPFPKHVFSVFPLPQMRQSGVPCIGAQEG